jgi:hypothetical protein
VRLGTGGGGGLVSFFDFIVAANGVPLRTLDSTFVQIIKVVEPLSRRLGVYLVA